MRERGRKAADCRTGKGVNSGREPEAEQASGFNLGGGEGDDEKEAVRKEESQISNQNDSEQNWNNWDSGGYDLYRPWYQDQHYGKGY